MSDLNEQTERGYTKRVSVTTGNRRGLLTAVRKLDVSQHGERWLYRCDCGGYRIAVTSTINRSVRNGATPACRSCATDLREAKSDKTERKRASILSELWESHRTLYGARWDQRVADEIMTELEREFGPTRSLEKHPVVVPVGESKVSSCQQRMVYLFPVGNDSLDEVWTCCHCGVPAWRCFECSLCQSAACIECVREERHKHYEPDDGLVLDDVAASFGVSRERIRQVEQGALGKIRHRSHPMFTAVGRTQLDLGQK